MAMKQANPRPDDTLTRDVLDALDALDANGKREVLDFSRALAGRRRADGPGGALLAFAGSIPADDLDLMERAIAEACERVAPDSW